MSKAPRMLSQVAKWKPHIFGRTEQLLANEHDRTAVLWVCGATSPQQPQTQEEQEDKKKFLLSCRAEFQLVLFFLILILLLLLPILIIILITIVIRFQEAFSHIFFYTQTGVVGLKENWPKAKAEIPLVWNKVKRFPEATYREAMIFLASGVTVYGCFLLGECLGRNNLFGYDVDDPDSVYSPSHYQ